MDKYKFIIHGTDKTRAMFKSLKANLTGTAGRIGALVGVGGMGAMINRSLELNDKLAKTSDRLGITTQSLAGLQHAAELTGVSSATMAKSLQQLQRRVSEATTGTGEAKDALDALGLSADSINAMAPDKQFETIAGALEGVANQGDKARIAYELFGRTGQDLLTTLNLGEAGLKAAKEEAEKYGVALSRVDAAKMEAANDAMHRVKQVTTGISNQVTLQLAHLIEHLATSFTEAAAAGGGMGKFIADKFKGIVKVVGVFANGLHGIKIIFKALKSAAFAFGTGLIGSINLLVNAYIGLGNTIKNAVLWPLRKVLEMASKAPGEVGEKAQAMLSTINTAFADIKPPEGLKNALDYMKQGTRDTVAELHALMMEKLPGDVLMARTEEILNSAQIRAEQMVAAQIAKVKAATGTGEDGGLTPEQQKEQEQLQVKLDSLRQTWMSEKELMLQRHDEEYAILDAYYATKTGMKAQADRDYAKLDDKHKKELAKVEEASNKTKLSMLGSSIQQIFGAASQGNKKLFKLQKAFSLAQAVATLPAAVIESFKNAGGYPWGIVPAAAMAATGLAQIAQIKSAQPSGGASYSPSVGGGSGAVASPPTTSLAGIDQFDRSKTQGPGSQVSITIAGDVIGDNGATIADKLRVLMEEQDVVLFSANSRQAQEFAT